jgi:small subunit ribosomal protein S1
MSSLENPWKEPLEETYWKALLSADAANAEDTPAKDEGPPEELAAFEREVVKRDAPDEPDSYKGQARGLDWARAEEMLCTGELIELPVTGYNRGGLLVEFGGLQGFVPASHLFDLPRNLEEDARQIELASYVGETMRFRVIELDRERNRLILSQRLAISDETVPSLLDGLKEGEIRRGRVTNLCNFGAFVDLGGVEGLIHISEMSWGRINHPADVVRPGDIVEVYVISVNRDQRRIALSIKRLQPDPWSLVEKRYRVGQLVEGTITNVVSFGAFTRIEDGLEGLIHISELAEGNFLHPRNVVREGDRVTVRILSIDGANHRLGLSLRQAIGPSGYSPPVA